MRKLLLCVVAVACFTAARSQSVAADWSHTDCSGGSHTLFSYLDAEDVVIMEFGMGCSTCTDAAGYLMDIKAAYEVSHPGKVKVFYMDYWAGNDCATDVVPTVAPYAFDAVFDHADAEKSYYLTGSPMPAIVIAGGSNHLVLSEKPNWVDSDTTTIKATIDHFFATVGVNESKAIESRAAIFPNPTTGFFTLDFTWKENETAAVTITDLAGKIVFTSMGHNLVSGKQQINLDAGFLEQGNYVVKVQSSKNTVNIPLTIQH